MFESYICENILSYSALSILRSSSLQYQFISRIRVSLVFMLNCSVYRTYNCTLSVLNVLSVATISLSYIYFFFFNCHYFFCCMSLYFYIADSRNIYTHRHIYCIELELPASASNPCRISNGFKGPLDSSQTFLTTEMTPLVSSVNH